MEDKRKNNETKKTQIKSESEKEQFWNTIK